MPTQLLALGINSVIQNQVYALPNRRCLLFTDTAAATLFQSNTEAFTLSTAITLTNSEAEVGGGFLKCTSAGPILVTLKAQN